MKGWRNVLVHGAGALNPLVIASYGVAFLASLFWWLTLRTLDLIYADAFTTLSYVLLLIFSAALFRRTIIVPKIISMIPPSTG
jgi:hypothetical protein